MRVITRMPNTKDPWLSPGDSGPCACTQLRRTARKVTALYDQALAPAGVTVTQYALLVNVGRLGKLSRTALANRLGMDRTTLTRNLMPLEKADLITGAEGEDRRERLICLSPAGLRKVRQSYELWENAQRDFTSRMGETNLKQFRSALTAAEVSSEPPKTVPGRVRIIPIL
jgi:DNA-binding MarR family transcriptional regulator